MRSTRIPVAGGSSGINNAIRGLASIVKRAVGSQGSAIPSAGTTAIGAAGTALYAAITGTTTITSFGAVAAGTLRIVEFAGALTLTHNATSLKLPGSANIVTAASDVGFFMSLGSGNWKCLHYSRADGSAVASFNGLLSSTDAGAADGPIFEAFRNSVSPAANDEIGQLSFTGNNSAIAKLLYGAVDAIILDPTAGSEDSVIRLVNMVSGSAHAALQAANGVNIGSPAGGFKGAGALNAATGVYIAGHGTIAQVVRSVTITYSSTSTQIPLDDSIPTNSEGIEILSTSIAPSNASSTLRIRVNLMTGTSAAGVPVCAALYVDSGSTALAARSNGGTPNNTQTDSWGFEHFVSAGSTSARTYKIRVGPGTAGTAYINGDGTSRLFGGAASSYIEVEEILPQ